MIERGSSEGQSFLRRRGAFSAANPQACGLILRNLFRVKPSVPLLTQRMQSLGRSKGQNSKAEGRVDRHPIRAALGSCESRRKALKGRDQSSFALSGLPKNGNHPSLPMVACPGLSSCVPLGLKRKDQTESQ